jgi:hypothetical protein
MVEKPEDSWTGLILTSSAPALQGEANRLIDRFKRDKMGRFSTNPPELKLETEAAWLAGILEVMGVLEFIKMERE